MRGSAATTITAKLADALYTEAMLLADETRSYLDGRGTAEREGMGPYERVVFACESLNATTRLMQVIAWVLSQKSGNVGRDRPAADPIVLADVGPIDPAELALLPPEARRMIGAGIDLYDRVRRLEEGKGIVPTMPSPALALLQRLERSL